LPRKDISNEEYAALRAEQLLQAYFNQDEITHVQVSVLGTSFGQTEGPYARPYKPLNAVDKLVAFADIAGFTQGFTGWMDESMDVLRETPYEKLPPDFEAVIKTRQGFIGYIEAKLHDIEFLIGPEATLEYQEELDTIKRTLLSPEVNAYRQVFADIQREAERKAANHPLV
jgi:hypothetical protein